MQFPHNPVHPVHPVHPVTWIRSVLRARYRPPGDSASLM